MRHRICLSFVLVLLTWTVASAQDTAKPAALRHDSASAHGFSKKAVSFSGTVSDDGKFFLADPDADVWTVTNPELVKSQQGQRVTLQAQTNAGTNEIRVLCVKPREGQLSSMAKPGDAAFRR
jgi:hypothetical protein